MAWIVVVLKSGTELSSFDTRSIISVQPRLIPCAPFSIRRAIISRYTFRDSGRTFHCNQFLIDDVVNHTSIFGLRHNYLDAEQIFQAHFAEILFHRECCSEQADFSKSCRPNYPTAALQCFAVRKLNGNTARGNIRAPTRLPLLAAC
jgi:hypothetical protein